MSALRVFLDEPGSIYQTRPDMEPVLDRTSGWGKAKPRGQTAGILITLLLGLGVARADTAGFTNDFAEAFWSKQPQFGSVNFSNSDTALVLAGPNAPVAETTSFDGILYNGPLPGGLAVGGTVQFHWDYNGGTTLSTSEADFGWSSPGGGGPIQNVLAQGGVGVITSGLFTTPPLVAGTTFEFLLGSGTTPGKLSAALVISDFQFHPDIPEPTTGVLLGSLLISLGAARGWRGGRQTSGQP
jgi:hypothetical protein